MWLRGLNVAMSLTCSHPRSYALRLDSPMYLNSFTPVFLSVFSCPSWSRLSCSCLATFSHIVHVVSYTIFLFEQSWLVNFPVLALVWHSRQFFLVQSSPCQGLDLVKISWSFVPVRSTILSLVPVSSDNFSSFWRSDLASSPFGV